MSDPKLNIHKLSILNPGIHKINTCNNNNLNLWGVEIFKVGDKEEDLVVGVAKSLVTIVDNHKIC